MEAYELWKWASWNQFLESIILPRFTPYFTLDSTPYLDYLRSTLLLCASHLPCLAIAYCGTASRTLSKSLCFDSFEVLVTWQRLGPFARDLRESHKKAGFSVVLDKNPFFIFNQLSFCTLHTIYALLFMPLFLLFCCQVTFCALVYFMWVFVLSQFPSHTT
jgi:hypothetical protein